MRGLAAASRAASRHMERVCASTHSGNTCSKEVRRLSTRPAVEGGVTLRYFDSRGRAQALRYALVDAGVQYKDDKVSMSHISSGNWFNLKNNPSISGPWGLLPVLDWGDFRVGQTEAIGMLLHSKLNPDSTQSEAAMRQACMSASLTSLAHQDLIVLCVQLINMTATMQAQAAQQQSSSSSTTALQPASVAQRTLEINICNSLNQCKGRVLGILPRLEMLLATNGAAAAKGADVWLVGAPQPTVGDFFIFEAVDMVRLVMGEEVVAGFPLLQRFCKNIALRPRIKEYIQAGHRPLSITGFPAESGVLAAIAAAAAAAAAH